MDVPKDAHGGTQRAGIFVESVPSGTPDDSGIINKYRIGYFLSSAIDGPGAKSEGKIKKLKIPQLLFVPPVRSSVLVENTGSLDFEVSYKMTVKKYFGGGEVYSKGQKALVMAETRRLIADEWGGSPKLGLFKVTEEATVLGETSTLTKTVLVIPIALMIAILVGILLLGMWIYAKVRKAKKGKKSGK